MRSPYHAGAWLVLGLAVALADSPVNIEPRPKPADQAEIAPAAIRAESNLVLISVSVIDPKNGPVTGLDKQNFRIYENKVEQRVVQLSREDQPAAVGIIFDTSGSMKKKAEKSRAAVTAFLRTANPEDEFFMVEFDNHAHLALPYTDQTQRIEEELTRTHPFGRTALLDAIYLGLQELRKSHKPRKALLIVSDGGDNCSRFTEADVRNLVNESDVRIYALGILASANAHVLPEEAGGPDLLSDIAEQTGGRLFPVANIDELPEAAARIGLELRNHYLVAYEPTNLHRDGKYHKVQVKVEATDRSRSWRVAWRSGYYAPAQ